MKKLAYAIICSTALVCAVAAAVMVSDRNSKIEQRYITFAIVFGVCAIFTNEPKKP